MLFLGLTAISKLRMTFGKWRTDLPNFDLILVFNFVGEIVRRFCAPATYHLAKKVW